jgi:PTH1 family peptidyl-tRNA hydrolase
MNAYLIAGLGNPGREYARTRHNVGFWFVTALAERWGLTFNRQRNRAEIAEGSAAGRSVILAKPQTYMNHSGDAVRALLKMSNLNPADLLVVHDEMDLPFGRLRLRDRGSSGGHNGVQSIIGQLGTTEFARLRIGVGRPPEGVDPIDYVLTPFTASELGELPAIIERARAGLEVLLSEGVTAAMNLVNVTPRPLQPPPTASRLPATQ